MKRDEIEMEMTPSQATATPSPQAPPSAAHSSAQADGFSGQEVEEEPETEGDDAVEDGDGFQGQLHLSLELVDGTTVSITSVSPMDVARFLEEHGEPEMEVSLSVTYEDILPVQEALDELVTQELEGYGVEGGDK